MKGMVSDLKPWREGGQIAAMIISPGRRYIFIHIPKTGGTSMAPALEARAKADDILIGDTPKAVKRKRKLKALNATGRLWKHARLADIDGMEGLPQDPFIFTMVRNPWERVLSFYYWARTQRFDHPLVRLSKSLEVNDFLASRAVETAFRNDAAESFVTDRKGVLRCDAFIRLEHLDTDLAALEAHLGFRLSPLPHVNPSNRPQAREAYEDSSRQRVADIFAADIGRFGYAFPDA